MIPSFYYEVDEEITLRLLTAKDAPALFAITDRSRHYLKEWLPWLDQTTEVADSKQFIENSFHLFAERTGLTAGIFYQEELVGVVGYNSFDWRNQIGYIGYWLAVDYQGKGIMSRAVSAMINYGFHVLQLNRIDIRAAYENKKSRAIAERLGFTKEGQIRQAEWLYDHYVDHIVYGMLAQDWGQSS
ncbi:GNAT family protein [Virgibacillus sp. LDC-1]|uniref:GNAT family N-acetyltransferase n=1 Tax=Virgibacillus sp. LDC-1 TaxID=3039856 RepID=UPI0024DE593E|nr:GNAT family protein [Virgibacillus sp. LDC-1]